MDFSLNDEQRMYQAAVRVFVDNEIAPFAVEVDRSEELHWEAITKMPPLGFTGLQVPEEYGGADLDTISAILALEELGRSCGSTALSIAAHNSLCCFPLVKWGTVEQKAKYLPLLTSGKKLGALALTEPDAGSDLSRGIRTTAFKDKENWILNGEKTWITNAPTAPAIITLVRTAPPAGNASHSLSQLIVDNDTPGLTIEQPISKMGVRGSHSCPLVFQDAQVPLQNLLGEEGRGLHQTLETLDGGRIGIAACSVGLAQAALDASLTYVKERQAFGARLADLQAIQLKLADIATQIKAARLLTYNAAWTRDQGKPFAKIAAMAKMYASDTAEKAAFKAIQMHGGYGYSTEFPVERIYRDQRMMSIGEGANDVLRTVIARHMLNP